MQNTLREIALNVFFFFVLYIVLPIIIFYLTCAHFVLFFLLKIVIPVY